MGYYRQYSHQSKQRSRKNIYLLLAGIAAGVLFMLFAFPASNDRMSEADKDQNNEGLNGGNSNDPQSIEAPRDINRETTYDITNQMTDVVSNVTPAVVGVINLQKQSDRWGKSMDGNKAGTGSGVIYKTQNANAFIVTNHHVIKGADTVEIVLSDGTHQEAEILGSDLFSDLAVLKMNTSTNPETLSAENTNNNNAQNYGSVDIGSSENVNVGETAIAIGNPLGLAFSGSVTTGVISGIQRTIPQDFNKDGRADWQTEVIQTDAAINPGNSGGALINIEGRLIGINSMKINEKGVEGIGFAIPIDSALPIMKELEETGEVKRPYLGVEIYSLDEVPQKEWRQTLNLPRNVDGGVYVWSVADLSPSKDAGMQKLDVITELDGESVMNMIDLRKILYQKKAIGEDVKVTYYRDGDKQETTITLGRQD